MLLDRKEITVIRNAMINVIDELQGEELSTRTGYEKEEIMELHDRIISSNKLSKTNDLLIANQVLNEICNGYIVKKFEHTIGENKDFVIGLLEKINPHIQKLT